MKLSSNLKRVFSYFFIASIVFMIIILACSLPSNSGSSSGSSNKGGSKKTEEITMSGNFSIKINPNIELINGINVLMYSMNSTEYDVTALDITVTQVSTGSIVGTFNWTPANGPTTYSVNISQYGEYEVKVVQTAENNGDVISTENSEIVNIQPMKIVIVTIVPGGSLDIIVDVDGPTYAVFPENFDSTAVDQVPNGWIKTNNPDTYAGVANYASAYSFPNCLKLYDNNGTKDASASALIMDSTYGQLSFYFNIEDGATTNSYCSIKNSTGDWLIDVCFNDSKKIEIRKPDGEKIPLMRYEFDTWYKVEIKWDKSTGYSKILINNIDYGNYQMKNPSNSIERIHFAAGTGVDPDKSTTLYIDNVNLTINAESITLQSFTENFDITPINQIPDGSSRGEVADTFVGVVNSGITPHSSPNCLMITDNNNIDGTYFRIGVGKQLYGQFTYYLYVDETSPWSGTGFSGLFGVFFTDEEEVIVVQPGDTLLTIGTYTVGTWTKVTIKWDAYRFNFKVIIDDVDLGNFPFAVEGIPSAVGFTTQGLDTGHLNYMDDLVFTVNPEFIE